MIMTGTRNLRLWSVTADLSTMVGASRWKRNFVLEKLVNSVPHLFWVQSSKTAENLVKQLRDLWQCYSEFLGNIRLYLKTSKCILRRAGELLRFIGCFFKLSVHFLIHDLYVVNIVFRCFGLRHPLKDEMSSWWLHYLEFYEELCFQTHAKLLKSIFNFYLFCFTVQSESGCANVVSAAPCLAEPQQYEVQFGRLRNFLTGKYREARKRKVTDFLVISVSKGQYSKI